MEAGNTMCISDFLEYCITPHAGACMSGQIVLHPFQQSCLKTPFGNTSGRFYSSDFGFSAFRIVTNFSKFQIHGSIRDVKFQNVTPARVLRGSNPKYGISAITISGPSEICS